MSSECRKQLLHPVLVVKAQTLFLVPFLQTEKCLAQTLELSFCSFEPLRSISSHTFSCLWLPFRKCKPRKTKTAEQRHFWAPGLEFCRMARWDTAAVLPAAPQAAKPSLPLSQNSFPHFHQGAVTPPAAGTCCRTLFVSEAVVERQMRPWQARGEGSGGRGHECSAQERHGCSSTKSVHSLIDIFHTATASSQELSSQFRYLSKWQTARRGCDSEASPLEPLSQKSWWRMQITWRQIKKSIFRHLEQ